MKYLILLAVVGGLIWLIKSNRKIKPPSETASSPTLDMVPCAHCGLHLPDTDAVHAQSGVYCSAEHRDLHERTGR
jgi:uncharacterized protein